LVLPEANNFGDLRRKFMNGQCEDCRKLAHRSCDAAVCAPIGHIGHIGGIVAFNIGFATSWRLSAPE